ncbi:MAG: serine/threonine protein kinase [Polyangiaceae bacterium]|nr:serine/threonine protein kinase [Polyangiaceae bacterium]
MKTSLFAAVLMVFALAGCGRPFKAATPTGFVDLGDKYADDEYRATTADGMVLGVRAFKNEPKGELDFWVKVIENRMRDTSGYALLGTKEAKDRAGNVGKTLRFGHDESGVPHLYYLTVFVNDDHVFLLEAGGSKDLVEKHEEQIAWSISNFLPN